MFLLFLPRTYLVPHYINLLEVEYLWSFIFAVFAEIAIGPK